MISVTIAINGHPIFTRSAINIKEEKNKAEYSVDDGSIIEHNPEDGAVVLAIKLLETIKEPRRCDDWKHKKKVMSTLSKKKREILEND